MRWDDPGQFTPKMMIQIFCLQPGSASVGRYKSLPGTDDRRVSECRLIDGDVPNGSFTLEYFYFRQYRERVRVQFGMLLAA
jgi:hypothetical protein